MLSEEPVYERKLEEGELTNMEKEMEMKYGINIASHLGDGYALSSDMKRLIDLTIINTLQDKGIIRMNNCVKVRIGLRAVISRLRTELQTQEMERVRKTLA
jgi:hypothetical protein